jgi:prepilin-type N-terminal cleavage/methylation domain-containing protein/prepilin-type processing-associated H-X9-DG protein
LHNRAAKAFTLIELLVVIAIIAILAAILFPVFAQAKQSAKKTKAISNMKQGMLAAVMYTNDYDDSYMLSDSGSVGGPGWGYGPPDTVPFQVMSPYTKNTEFVIDPMDPWQSEQQRINDQCPLMTGCTLSNVTPTQRAYALGVRSNMGYNFAFFSPWIYQLQATGFYIGSASVNASEVTQPAHTLMFGTSIWNRTPGGAPTGGGNWVVQTPCWNDNNGNLLPPMSNFQNYAGSGQAYSYGVGWDSNPLSWIVYGGLWPFYAQTSSNALTGAQNGQVVIGFADGHVKAMPISQVATGCSAYGTGGALPGRVTDSSKFLWAINQ